MTSGRAGTISAYPELSRIDALIERSAYDAAAKALIGFLRDHPEHPHAYARLGHVANRLGALGQAGHFLRKAIAGGAREFEVRRELASVLHQQDKPEAAIPMFEALSKERDDPTLQGILAGLLEKIGRYEESREMFGKLAHDNPTSLAIWISYGHSLRASGQVERAIAAYRHVIAADDGLGDAWWGLASIKRATLNDEDIERIRHALAIAVDVRNEAPLHFALAKALHDRGEFDSAFEHYEEGNRLRAEELQYQADELSEEIERTEQLFSAQFLARLPAAPISNDRPIFIISLPRSGSTLLEQMLGSHSRIEPLGELPYIPAILRTFMEIATRRGTISVPRAIAGLSDDQAEAMGRDYLRRAALHRKTSEPFFIDKLPHNWSNVLFIRRILPQARFIDIRRPAMDCCFSNYTQSFTSAHASSFALRDVARSYKDNLRLMQHLDQVAPGMIAHVDYRALVAEPRDQIERTLAYLGLEWEDAVLDFHNLDRVVRTPSSEQVRRPLNTDGVAVWKPYAKWLGPLREELGSLAESHE